MVYTTLPWTRKPLQTGNSLSSLQEKHLELNLKSLHTKR